MTIELIIAEVEGWLAESEARMLNRMAAEIAPPQCVVEIGSYRGRSSCALGHNLQAGVVLYCIDPQDDWTVWQQNVQRFIRPDGVIRVQQPSLEAVKSWNKPIGMIFFDGDHPSLAADLDAWLPHVAMGGMVAIHDTDAEHVRAAYRDRNMLLRTEACDVTTVFRKEASPYERYEHNGLTCFVRTGHYGPVDKHAVQEVQTYQLPDFPLTTVIDAGAMIGAFTSWIQKLYPEAKIVAIEPEPGNYALAGWNVSKNVLLLNGVLAYDATRDTLIVDPHNSGGHELVRASEVKAGQVSVTSLMHWRLEDLMMNDFEQVDLLKLDIEGSEMDVLLNAEDETLKRVRFIVGERHFTHNDFLPVIQRLEALGFVVEDKSHPEMTTMPNRGLFTALNQIALNRTWNQIETTMAEDQAAAAEALAKDKDDVFHNAYAQEARKRATRKAKR
jgi:FkbM family methyltransferase